MVPALHRAVMLEISERAWRSLFSGDPARVTWMSYLLALTVLMPNTLTIQHGLNGGTTLASVINSAGGEAISNIVVSLS